VNKPIDLISLTTENSSVAQPQPTNILDLLGGTNPASQQPLQPLQPPIDSTSFSANMAFMNSNYLGMGTTSTQNVLPNPSSQNNFQSNFQNNLNPQPYQSNAFGNISLSSNFAT